VEFVEEIMHSAADGKDAERRWWHGVSDLCADVAFEELPWLFALVLAGVLIARAVRWLQGQSVG